MAFSLSQMYVAPHRLRHFANATDSLERWLESQRERLSLWVPVLLAVGISAWFFLPDPMGWACWIGGCATLALTALALPYGGRLRMVIVTAALLAASGSVLIWGKALIFGEAPLSRPVFMTVSGEVLRVERQTALQRIRLTVRPDAALGLPDKIRVNVGDDDWQPEMGRGARIGFRARLMPPAPPAVPGAYDFAQRAYFLGLGASGKALPPFRIIRPSQERDGSLRRQLADHILTRLSSAEAGIAVALATGDQGAISEADAEAMRQSGLAHLLSISGLHVSALIGAVILLIYRLLALSPGLALRWPLMLIAAAGGAVAGIGYTLLTGAEVPTIRSCIAALLVLGGLALGREPISLRLVATGALIVLLFWPEALIGPSFQMSFAAVTVLIALAEARWFKALVSARDEGRAMKLARSLLGLFLTGVAIEAALMPIAVYHFHQAGLLGAFANLIAIPLSTFVIMPAEALALIADMFGMGAPLWWVVERALAFLLGLAHFVGANPLATWAFPPASALPFALSVGGGLWLILWQGRGALLGLLPLTIGIVLTITASAPDVLVTGDGRHMALRMDDGRIALLRGGAGDYIRDVLGASSGEGSDGQEGMLALADTDAARCSRDLCSVALHRGGRSLILLATRTNMRLPWTAMVTACARADIVVSDRRLPKGCVPRWLKLDRAFLHEHGGVAIYAARRDWRAVRQPGDRHPWIVQ